MNISALIFQRAGLKMHTCRYIIVMEEESEKPPVTPPKGFFDGAGEWFVKLLILSAIYSAFRYAIKHDFFG